MRNSPAGKLTISSVTRLDIFSVNGVGETIRGIGETGFLSACKAFKTCCAVHLCFLSFCKHPSIIGLNSFGKLGICSSQFITFTIN